MTRFSDLELDPKVLKAVEEAGYDAPTPIQKDAIPPALEGRDVLGIAQTGTGKTAGFTLPMITRLARGRARARMPRSLILCPTRELAAQVAENFDTYAKYTRLTKALLIGGVSFGEQDKLIDRGVDVLIATPGRLLDHFERGKLLLTGVEVMVVDEADRMLDMGFIPDIERIFQLTPLNRQTLFFSATMAPEIERITNTFMHSPARIEVARQATASETIEQRLITLKPTRKDQTAKQKRQLLRALIDAEGDRLTNAIIFSNRKTDVDILTKSLRAHGYDAAAIHGDLNQSHRTRTLDEFRDGKLRFLVASDVAARGLDIPEVSHVFNYDLPSHAEDYVHRIGRTGRAGREGVAISIEEPLDDKYLAAIESLLKRALPRLPVPEGFVPTEGTRRDRGRSRPTRGRGHEGSSAGRGREKAGANGAAAADKPADSAAQAVSEQPRSQDQGASGSRSASRGSGSGQAERGTDRHEDQRSRQPRGGDRSRGHAVRGMGDHVPEFLTRSFFDALTATERADTARQEKASAAAAREKPVDEPAEAEAETPQPAEKADAKPATTRSRTRKPAEKPAEAEKADTGAPDAEAAKPEAGDGAAEKPKPTRRRATSTRSKAAQDKAAAEKALTAEAAGSDAATGETPADTAPAAGKDEAEAKPAPRRRAPARPRSSAAAKKADDAAKAAETGSDTTADASPDDAPKPAARRSRAKAAAPKAEPDATDTGSAEGDKSEPAPAEAKKPAVRKPATRTRKAATAADTTTAEKAEPDADAPKPVRRSRAAASRKPAADKPAKDSPANTGDNSSDAG